MLASYVKLFTVALWSLFVVVVHAEAQEINVSRELEGANANYQWEAKKAREQLIKGFDEAVKALAQSGDLDAVKSLIADKELFIESGKLSKSQQVKPFIDTYLERKEAAEETYRARLKELTKSLTKSLRLEDAEKVRDLLMDFDKSLRANEDPPELQNPPKEEPTTEPDSFFSSGKEFEGNLEHLNSKTPISLRILHSSEISAGSSIFVAIASWEGREQLRFVGEISGSNFSMYSSARLGPIPVFPVIYQGTRLGDELSGEWFPKIGVGKTGGRFFLQPAKK